MLLSTARRHKIDKISREAEQQFYEILEQKNGKAKYAWRRLNHFHKKASKIARLTYADCMYSVASKN